MVLHLSPRMLDLPWYPLLQQALAQAGVAQQVALLSSAFVQLQPQLSNASGSCRSIFDRR